MGATDKTRVLNILEQTLRLSRDEREGHLRRACEGDEELLQAVTVRLRTAEAGPDLDEEETPVRGSSVADVDVEPGDDIGPYHLISLLGEGGMGLVFLAEQREPVQRRVALKLIKLGMDTREVLSRFDSERTALAMMNHPNVASALDAGTTDSGRPYFVMEYVDGINISEFCDDHRMTVRERLELVSQACDGIEHAHQKGIIHRDLKPNNVLVSRSGGRPLVKIIDFGIAKSTEQKLVEDSFLTRFGVIIGTPSYMSPEQAGRDPLDIDTRSDVYSLGVMLYELLTGTPPFGLEQLEQKSLGEIQHIIREEYPPKPSDRIKELGAAGPKVARRRQTELRALRKKLRGELNWIVMRALAKDRNMRYQSAAFLSDDIRRYLTYQPVKAGPPSRIYRLKKFIRRHKVLVVATSMVTVALVSGLLIAGWALLEADRAHQQTERQAAVTQATNALLYELFVPETSEAATDAGGQSLDDSIERMLSRLDTGTAFVGPDFAGLDQGSALGEVELAIRSLVADRDQVLERRESAAVQYAKATRLARSLHGQDSTEWLDARTRQAENLAHTDGETAARMLNEVINRGGQVYGSDHPLVLAAQFGLAELRRAQGKSAIAGDLLEEASRRNAAARSPSPLLEARLLTALAEVAIDLEEPGRALEHGEAALAHYRSLYGENSLQAGASALRQAGLARRFGSSDRAVTLYQDALAVHRIHFGYRALVTGQIQLQLAGALMEAGDPADASRELTELLTALRALQNARFETDREPLIDEAARQLAELSKMPWFG